MTDSAPRVILYPKGEEGECRQIVEIRYRTRKLEKQYANRKEAEKAYGKVVARRYIERVNIIKTTKDIEELQRMPGLNCHKLLGKRKG